jgi:Uma2 family endonuclease
MNPDDLLAMPDGDKYELVKGIPVEKIMGAESGEVTVLLLIQLGSFVWQNGLGHVYDGQTGFQCFPHDAGLVRKPDVSFVARGRLPGEKSPKGNIKLAPDLAVEVVSPNDLYEEVETKVAEYRSAGVRLIWVVSPSAKTVVIRRLDGTCAEVGEAGELSGEDAVPGFVCKVAELFV